MLTVTGSDDSAGTGDAWNVKFLGRFPTALSVTSSSSVNISIGTNNTNNVALTNNNGLLVGSGGGVTKFRLDTNNKGRGSFTTNVLTKASTSIPVALTPGTVQAYFATNMTFSTGAAIESALGIFAKKSKISAGLECFH